MKIPKLAPALGIALCVLGFSRSSLAAFNNGDTLFIDFGTAGKDIGQATVSPDVNGNYWNNALIEYAGSGTNFPSGGWTPASLSNLITTSNGSTSVGLSFSSRWQTNGYSGGGLTSPSASLLGDFAIATATADYWFAENGNGGDGTASMTFSGLNPSYTYNFDIFATRDTDGIRNTLYSISDVNGLHTSTLQTSGPGSGTGSNGNNDTLASLYGIVPNAFGEITLTVSRVDSTWGYIGLLSITAVPEPGAYGAAAAAACIALAALRRRRQGKRVD